MDRKTKELRLASAWSRHVNNRDRERFLIAYAGDLVYDGWTIAKADQIDVVFGVLRDMGSDLIFDHEKLHAMANVNPESERVLWFRYDPEGRTNGWEGTFVPTTAAEALAFWQESSELAVKADAG